uniref:Uncharacterized protein n=1 Tax=Physcomitrium patens TaxID=3218 RepID=A0A7I4C4Z9_PHYPA
MASSYRSLLATVKAELVVAKGASHSRIELFHALDKYLPDFQAFLIFPGPRAEDRTQVVNSPSNLLEKQDIQLALMLSDDFNLNEAYCAGLVISGHEQRNRNGWGRQEMMQIAAGLWFTERESLIKSLQLLLHVVALNKELDSDFVGKIRQYLEKLLNAGIRTRIMSLIKELNEEESTRLMDQSMDQSLQHYIKDSSGVLVERCAAIQKLRLSLCDCLYLSCLITPLDAAEVKYLYNLLKVCSADGSLLHDVVKLRITYTIMFSLTNAIVLGAEGCEHRGLVLALDANSREEFQQLMLDEAEVNSVTEGFTGLIRLAWVTIGTLTKQTPDVTAVKATVEDDSILYLCLNRACDRDVFGFLNTHIFETAAFQNDEKASAFKFTTGLCKLVMGLLSLPAGRQKIMEFKYTSMMALDIKTTHLKDSPQCSKSQAQIQAVKCQAQPLVSFLHFVREIFQREPELVLDNNDLWSFVHFAGECHSSYFTLVAFLDMLTALAECKEGAGKVYDLLQKATISNLGWQNLSTSLVFYDQQLRLCVDTPKGLLPPFTEGDARIVEAYLKVMKKVIEKGDVLERMQWFEDIEPLFKLLSCQKVPPFLKGALRNAIAACACVSPVMKQKVYELFHLYDLPVLVTLLPTDRCGQLSSKQVFDLTYELNEVEARQREYPSTISYMKLRNVLIPHELDARDTRYSEFYRFVRDQVFGLYSQRLYANPTEKWELVVASLHLFEILLNKYDPINEDVRNDADNGFLSDRSFRRMSTTSTAEHTNTTPAMELMKDLKNGEVIYSNLMNILALGVESLLDQRTSQLYGAVLEEAISLSFQIFIHAFLKESQLAEACNPSLQMSGWGRMLQKPLHEMLFYDSQQVVTLLEYVRYFKSQPIQLYSVKIMGLLSARVPTLVSVLRKSPALLNIIEAYAACLEARILEAHPSEIPDEDIGLLILQLLHANLSRPAPNLTHLLLGFDVNEPVEKTTLQPNFKFSCLTVILHTVDKLVRPEVDAGLLELCFQLLYELCVDQITCGPMVELLRNGKYDISPKKTSRTSHDTCVERENSSISGTNRCSSEAEDMDLQVCDLEPVAGSMPGPSSIPEPEVGFSNPEPLASRYTTKDNGGLCEGMAVLRSSWIQRLFPGMMGEYVKPTQEKGKEKHVSSAYEDTERLLIENASKTSEVFGSCSEVLGTSRDQARESFCDDGTPGRFEEGSSIEPDYECSNSSRPPPAVVSKQRPAPARVDAESEYRCEVGSQTPSILNSENSTRLLTQPACSRLPPECSTEQVLALRNRMDCATKVVPSILTKYEQVATMQTFVRPLELKSHNEDYLRTRGAGNVPSEHEMGRKSQVSSMYPYKLPADLDTKIILEEHSSQRHLLSTSDVARKSQNKERNRFVLSSAGTNNKTAVQPESTSPRFKQSGLHLGNPRHSSYKEYSLAGEDVGWDEPRVDKEKMGRNIGHQTQHSTVTGKIVDSSLLPPLSLFAPFKHSKERRSAKSEGKTKMAPGLSGESLLTPLFSPCSYKKDKNDDRGVADVCEDKFDSVIFSPYKPLSSLHNSAGIRESEALTLTPVFAPFKTLEEQKCPASAAITECLPVDLMEQNGDNTVVQYPGAKTDLISGSNFRQVEHMIQSNHQLVAPERSSSVYSSYPRRRGANYREAAVHSTIPGPHSHEEQHRVESTYTRGFLVREEQRTMNTATIDLCSRRPRLQEERTGYSDSCQADTNVSMVHSHDVQMSLSQGMQELFQFDKDLQQQVNTEAEGMRELRSCSNLVCEASSGSSPVPCENHCVRLPSQSTDKHLASTGPIMPGPSAKYSSKENYHQRKGNLEGSGVQGGYTLKNPSALVTDVEKEQSPVDKQTRGGATKIGATAQSPDNFRKREFAANREYHAFNEGKNISGQSGSAKFLDAQGDRSERSSRKRTHEARTGASQSAFKDSETPSVVVPQNEFGVEELKTTPRAQSWLQRWMPSSKPVIPVFEASQGFSSQMPTKQSSSHAKNPRLVHDNTIHGQRLDEAGSAVLEEHRPSAMERSGQLARSNFENYHRRSSPLCPGFYPLPSAAAMALVGAASRRAAPLPPQRSVQTRISVWPAIAGIQLRRTELGSPGVLSPQVEVDMVEEG